MPTTVFGLPAHALVVHATVVMVPLAAVLVAAAALSTRFRHWAGYLPAAASLLALVLVPLTTSTGESLQSEVPATPLVEQHVHLADGLLPFVIVLFAGAVGLLWLDWREPKAPREAPSVLRRFVGSGATPTVVSTIVVAVAVLGAAGTVVQTVRIGHAGARAAWSQVAQR